MPYRITALALFCLVFLVLVPPLLSQEPGPAQKLENLSQLLNLSPEQKMQLAPILRAEAPKVQAIKNDPSLSGIQKMEGMRAVHNETDPIVRNILTPTQYQEWQNIRKVEIEQMMRRGGGR